MLCPETRLSIQERVAKARALIGKRVSCAAESERHARAEYRATITVLCNNIDTILDDIDAGEQPPMTEGGA